MLRTRTPPVRYPNMPTPPPPPPPTQYPVPPRTFDFEYGVHNSTFQRRIFGEQAHLPALLMEASEIPNAGYGIKVVNNTTPDTWLMLYGVEISMKRAKLELKGLVIQIEFA